MSTLGLLTRSPRAAVSRVVRTVTGGESPLAGRTVLITGASSGIGEATAHAAARRGAVVLLVARREAELARVREAITAEGGTAHTYVADLTDHGSIDALVARVLPTTGWSTTSSTTPATRSAARWCSPRTASTTSSG